PARLKTHRYAALLVRATPHPALRTGTAWAALIISGENRVWDLGLAETGFFRTPRCLRDASAVRQIINHATAADTYGVAGDRIEALQISILLGAIGNSQIALRYANIADAHDHALRTIAPVAARARVEFG